MKEPMITGTTNCDMWGVNFDDGELGPSLLGGSNGESGIAGSAMVR